MAAAGFLVCCLTNQIFELHRITVYTQHRLSISKQLCGLYTKAGIALSLWNDSERIFYPSQHPEKRSALSPKTMGRQEGSRQTKQPGRASSSYYTDLLLCPIVFLHGFLAHPTWPQVFRYNSPFFISEEGSGVKQNSC